MALGTTAPAAGVPPPAAARPTRVRPAAAPAMLRRVRRTEPLGLAILDRLVMLALMLLAVGSLGAAWAAWNSLPNATQTTIHTGLGWYTVVLFGVGLVYIVFRVRTRLVEVADTAGRIGLAHSMSGTEFFWAMAAFVAGLVLSVGFLSFVTGAIALGTGIRPDDLAVFYWLVILAVAGGGLYAIYQGLKPPTDEEFEPVGAD
jgi:hypothetical protein